MTETKAPYVPEKIVVSFIIPVRDGENPSNAIQSIQKLNVGLKPEYNITILDLKTTLEDYAEFNGVAVYRANGQSYALARIAAARAATGNALAFMYPDAVCTTPDWLNICITSTTTGYFCTKTANLTTHAIVGHGAGLSLQPSSMLNHSWITRDPHVQSADIPCLRGPLIIVIKMAFVSAHSDVTDELFDGYEDQFLSLRLQYQNWKCSVLEGITVYTDRTQTELVHPFTHYCGLYSVLHRLGFDEEYINLCIEATPISREAYARYDYVTSKKESQDWHQLNKHTHEHIHKVNRSLNVKFDDSCGDLKLPPITSRLKTFGRAVQLIAERLVSNARYVIVAKSVRERRTELCKSCPMFRNSMCAECGCLVDAKIAVATESCPLTPPIWSQETVFDYDIKTKTLIGPATLTRSQVVSKKRIPPKQQTPACEWCKQHKFKG